MYGSAGSVAAIITTCLLVSVDLDELNRDYQVTGEIVDPGDAQEAGGVKKRSYTYYSSSKVVLKFTDYQTKYGRDG